jgi:hypothetical protein
VAESVIPREQTALPQTPVDAENAEPEAGTNTRLPAERAPPASPFVAVTTDSDTTILGFDEKAKYFGIFR